MGVEGTAQHMLPVGPPPKFEEVLAHEGAEVLVCKPCAEARRLTEDMLVAGTRFGGMDDFYAHASREDARVITF